MEIPVLGVCQTEMSVPFSHHQLIYWCPVLLCKAAALPRAPQVKHQQPQVCGSDHGSLPRCTGPNHPGAFYAKNESNSYVFHGLDDVSGNS